MQLMEIISQFTWLDKLALGVLFVCWLGTTWIIENPPKRRPSTASLVGEYRRRWMVQFVDRNARIFDGQIIGNLRQGTSFFASACMIAIGGGLALIGNTDKLRAVAQDLTPHAPPQVVWEVKLIIILIFAANAFLKFVWSHRLFGYCSVLMAAVPNDPSDPVALPRAAKAAEINITATKSFNRGLRAVYFGIAALAWLIGALPLLLATLFTLGVVLRREFASQSRAVLLDPSDL
jgi:uncharacterized membrane protein